ncbi:MAG TPA: twin-arginine translocation signal domain-containing protein, partial [Caldithrix abyssi]|nr:twin-arginine translocation signal domain-containing protein [Caldithrix abyssi]
MAREWSMEKSIRDISRRRFLEKAGVLAGGLGLAGL